MTWEEEIGAYAVFMSYWCLIFVYLNTLLDIYSSLKLESIFIRATGMMNGSISGRNLALSNRSNDYLADLEQVQTNKRTSAKCYNMLFWCGVFYLIGLLGLSIILLDDGFWVSMLPSLLAYGAIVIVFSLSLCYVLRIKREHSL